AHTTRTPEEIEALRQGELGDLETLHEHEPAGQRDATAHDLGLYVEDVPPWRSFTEFTDEEWEQLRPLLPKHMRGGRRRVDDRALLNGIFWVYTTRSRWREMPARYGNFWTAKQRLKRWREQGIWEPILEQARSFGYALTEGDFLDYEDEHTDHHEGLFSNGDDPGQQARAGPESEGEVPSGSATERPDPDSDAEPGSGAVGHPLAQEAR
ncbi:MAG: transposase, partial [Dehalococcoidia bacterium]